MKFDGTLRSLILCYKTDPYSQFCKSEKRGGLRYPTKQNYSSLMKRIEADHGDARVADIDGRMLTDWYQGTDDAPGWLGADEDKPKFTIAHSLIGMIRTLATYGTTMLKDAACRELRQTLSGMRFKMPKKRSEQLTAEQVVTIRTTARAMGLSSLARAQAFQFECTFRQKDCIGEWVPESEAGKSDTTHRGLKWLRGIRWEEIDDRLVLHHITSKRLKPVKKNLRLMPMVVDELQAHYCDLGEPLTRGKLPLTGPIIIFEETERPYLNYTFRRTWRKVATAAGIPKHIRNMDSRAGAITEALSSGAPMQKVRKAATHSNQSTTEGYSRGDETEDAEVSEFRVAARIKQV